MNPESKSPVVDNLVPVGFRVLLNIYKKPTETTSGFVLPEQENDGMPVMAQITILGKKTFWQRMQMVLGYKPRYIIGQWVYFKKYSVDELRFSTPQGDLALFVLEESEIIGVVKTSSNVQTKEA